MSSTTQHDKHHLRDNAQREHEERGDAIRPFLAHVRMDWWRPILITVVLIAAMVIVPVVGAIIGATLEMALFTDFGSDP